jgi:hypothetical protein
LSESHDYSLHNIYGAVGPRCKGERERR